ncbi:MAG: homoserine kinase [Candidatus Marinimicrobia bacterium]|jgi:homoserine kinase type II|nr:homoserine kinase [Candidatus Neomarinimicrobiota bacterium]MDP7608131.1 homoserine kinase [Candidatus Neomarinimicrobiota bacterium]HJM47416.1 homoserine kinase [Candidatus Neomarinimicrobiota bacterium]
MATYTQLNQQDIQSLANNYDLKIVEFSSLDGGNGNSSYILKTQQSSYVLTVCDNKEFDEVFKMGKLLLLLEAHNVPCNRLILPVNSEILTTFATADGFKPVMLKDYIEGQVVEQLDESILPQVGIQVAQLNQIPPPDYLPTNHPYGRQLFPTILGLNIDAKYESWMAEEIDYLEQNIAVNLPRGLIHGDLFYDNLLFDPLSGMPGEFKAIIDFEEACHYHLIFELGMAILGTCVNDIRVDLNKARALVKGYQEVRPLVQIEKESLQLFVRYAAVATSYWRFKKYNIEEPIKDRARHHWQMVQIAKGVSEISITCFFDAIFRRNVSL